MFSRKLTRSIAVGAVLVLNVDNTAPLALATGLLAAISVFTYRASRSTLAWAYTDTEP